MSPENGKPRASNAGSQIKANLGSLDTAKIASLPQSASGFSRHVASRIPTDACWRAHYWQGELVGSIRLTSFGAFEARDRRQQPIALSFATWDAAAAAL